MEKHKIYYEVIKQVRPAFKYLTKAVENNLEGTGLTIGMRAVLELLSQRGDSTVPEIARQMSVERQYIQLVVNDLIKLCLVSKIPNPSHKRSLLIKLTPEGLTNLDNILAREEENIKKVSKSLSKSDIETALRVMQHMTENFRMQTYKMEN